MAKNFIARLLSASALVWSAVGVQAAPLAYAGTQYLTSATAAIGGAADVQFGDSNSTPLPLTSSAAVFDTANFAAGGAIGVSGLLSTDAEAASAAGFASATGTSEFIGSFAGGGTFTFQFNYLSQDFTDRTAYSASTLYFQLTSNGKTLVNQIFPVVPSFSYSLFIPSGTTNTVDVLLSSEASTATGGNAQNVASVNFLVAQVPEPTTWFLLFAGLAVVVVGARLRTSTSEYRFTDSNLDRRSLFGTA